MKVFRRAQRLAGLIHSAVLLVLLWREFGWLGPAAYLGTFLAVGFAEGVRDVMSQFGARP